MTTLYDFTPSDLTAPPFSFQPTLDGKTYNVTATWNVFGQRWYLNCFALDGTHIFTLPLLGSTTPKPLTSLTWANGIASGTWQEPDPTNLLPVRPNQLVNLTFANNTPSAFNGIVQARITAPQSFQFPLHGANPGIVTQLGTISYDIDIAGGYFQTSTLVYRIANRQIEVSP